LGLFLSPEQASPAASGSGRTSAAFLRRTGPPLGAPASKALVSPVAAYNAKTALPPPHGIPEKVRCRKEGPSREPRLRTGFGDELPSQKPLAPVLGGEGGFRDAKGQYGCA